MREPPRQQGRFIQGHAYSPATQIKAGDRLSPSTEFKAGQRAHNHMPVGSITIRTRNGGLRALIKVAEPNVWRDRARIVWEASSGRRLPKGHVIHHRDRNMLNDDLSNLQIMTRAEHAREHHSEVVAHGFGNPKKCHSARGLVNA